MSVLELRTTNYTLTVEAAHVDRAYEKAAKRSSAEFPASASYVLDAELGANEPLGLGIRVGSAVVELDAPGQMKATRPVFFENKDYLFDISFEMGIDSQPPPKVLSATSGVEDKFFYRRGILTGSINFGNDIGRFALAIRYRLNGIDHEDHFSFDVFPTKLDYKQDYQQILDDINAEYAQLVYDFLRKTHQSLELSPQTNPQPQVIWFTVFKSLYVRLIRSYRLVLNKPHNRLVKVHMDRRADKIRHASPALEEQLQRHSLNPGKYYRTEERRLTVDTIENRFLKYAIREIDEKLSGIVSIIEKNYYNDLSDSFRAEMAEIQDNLSRIRHHQFFRSIGGFDGMRQESPVLQKRAGYSAIYHCWLILQQSLTLFDGVTQIGVKQISELYEIWCFLEMKKIINSIDGVELIDVNLAEVNFSDFVFTLKQGEKSKLKFVTADQQEVLLYHEISYGSKKDGFGNKSFTVDQRPDIVLRITKNDLYDNCTLTYLYDAKYRVGDDGDEDAPTSDSINQMHRYRDAIYYQDHTEAATQAKEVIGGYVLFPGRGSAETVTDMGYHQSIQQVNIGAFPLLPGIEGDDSRGLLKAHLESVVCNDIGASQILRETIPQKGMSYVDVDGLAFCGVVKRGGQTAYFGRTDPKVYHIPVRRNHIQRINEIRYFAPMISGKGIDCYYPIELIEVQRRSDIFPTGHPLYSESENQYYVFTLGERVSLQRVIKPTSGGNLYRYSRLSKLRSPLTVDYGGLGTA